MTPRLLIVHPEPSMVFRLEQPLRVADFEVMTASTLCAMQRKLPRQPDLILLSSRFGRDTILPLIQFLWTYHFPTLVMHHGACPDVVIEALSHDALDVVSECIDLDELVARIRRGLRLSAWSVPPVVGDIVLLLDLHLVMLRGRLIRLTPLETQILTVLASHQGQVVTQHTLLNEAWDGMGEEPTVASLWVRIRSLREKVERDPRHPEYLQTVRGVGYRLVLPAPAVSRAVVEEVDAKG